MILLWLAAVVADPMNTSLLEIPRQYQQETVVKLHTFNTQAGIDKACGGPAPEGYTKIGCGGFHDHTVNLGNPCFYPEATMPGTFAHDLCHEIGHTEGWHHINE